LELTKELRSFPILSLHAWLNRQPFKSPFVGFYDRPYHWAFRKEAIMSASKPKHVSMVISAAKSMMTKSKEELVALAEKDLMLMSDGPAPAIRRSVIVRENEATWVPPLQNHSSRLPTQSVIPNLLMAGDWTDTSLPATIEGAVTSGHQAASRARNILQPRANRDMEPHHFQKAVNV